MSISVPLNVISVSNFVPAVSTGVNVKPPVDGISVLGLVPTIETDVQVLVPVDGIVISGLVPSVAAALGLVWPPSLPQEQFLGLTEQEQDARLRTQMDAGPAIMRRRFTATVRDFTIPILLNGTQRQTLDTFYITTLLEGVLAFEWVDPVDDTTVSFRFVEPIRFTPIAGGTPADRLWEGTMSLEIVP